MGIGAASSILSFTALGWSIWRVTGSLWRERKQPGKDSALGRLSLRNKSELVILAWVLPYFLTTGVFFVKFMRYMQPLMPFLMVFSAGMLLRPRPPWLRRLVVTVTLIATSLYALSFANMYNQEHPWVAASRWLFQNAPVGATILSEQWDEGLPSSMDVDGVFRRRFEYEADELTWLTDADQLDDEKKLAENLERLAAADYVTLASNRVYGVVPRMPERYPLSSQYHQLLFDGTLGYELVYASDRSPNLAGYALKVDTFGWPALEPPAQLEAFLDPMPGFSWGRSDESYVVYDQPLTMIFANSGRLTSEEMLMHFDLDTP